MKNVLLSSILGLTSALLAWRFEPAIDLSCSSASSALTSSFILAYPKFAELVVGGISFGPLLLESDRVSASLLTVPFDSCITGGSVSGTVTSNATNPQTLNISNGELPPTISLKWNLTLVLQFRANSSVTFKFQSTVPSSDASSSNTQLKAVSGATTQILLNFDQPVLLKNAEAFLLPEGVSVMNFERMSALQYAIELQLASFQVASIVLPPVDGPFGSSALGKTIAVANIQRLLNPPLLLSEDLGFFRHSQTVLLVVFGVPVSGMSTSCFSVSSTQGPSMNGIELLESPGTGQYRVLLRVQGEGVFTIVLAAGCVTIGNSSSMAANITLTRDITPPSLQLTSLQGNQTRNTSFELELNASEPIYVDDRALALRSSSGSASLSRLRPESPARFSATVTDIGVDLDGFAVLNVELQAGRVSDLAGNVGPPEKLRLTVRAVGNSSRPPKEYFAPPVIEGDSALQWVLIALAVLLVGLILVFVVSKRRQKQVWAPADTEEEFENYGMRVFEQYAGPEQEYMTFDDIVRHSNSHGYPIAESERGAKVLLRAAGSGDRISREQWMRWLRRKVTRGQTPTANHIREMKAVFPL